MKFLITAIVLVLCVFGCAHDLKTAGDLRIGETYEIKMENEAKGCLFTVRNVITAVPNETGVVIPSQYLGYEAMMCGELDCTKTPIRQKSEFECLPFEVLK